MNYIEYMEDGNKINTPQYIPGFKQIQPFRRYWIKPSEPAVVPQGMYVRNFKFNSNEPISIQGTNARHFKVPTVKPESNTSNIFTWLNYPTNQLSYNIVGMANTSPVNRVSYITSAQ